MTREEAKDYIREWCPYDRQEEIIKALEQEPCEDCISRQAVLEVLKNNRYRFNISQEGYCEGKVLWSENLIKDDACKEIEQLPSVTPKEKTGRWEPIEYDGYADGYPVWDVWECSKCGLEHNGDKESLTAFCPDCGAKMVEPQESEDKE